MAQTTSAGSTAGDVSTDQAGHENNQFLLLFIGAIGVVYGDIGTSPLYAFREALHVSTGAGAPFNADTVLGLLSLIVWALVSLVLIKYVTIVLRADNKGEGGTLSILALALSSF